MALDNTTSQARLDLANALENAAAKVRNNIQYKPVNHPTAVLTALAKAKTLLDAAIVA